MTFFGDTRDILIHFLVEKDLILDLPQVDLMNFRVDEGLFRKSNLIPAEYTVHVFLIMVSAHLATMTLKNYFPGIFLK